MFFTFSYFAVLFAAHFYLFSQDSLKIVEFAVTGLHALGAIVLSFYIVYRVFRVLALGSGASLLYKITDGPLIFLMFYMMFNSLLYVHGIKFIFQEVKKPDRDMTLIYFAISEISLCTVAVILRLIVFLAILSN